MELAWITDPHFNFVDDERIENVYQSLSGNDLLAISGDIGESSNFLKYITKLSKYTKIVFIPGNHDYYSSSFSLVDQKIHDYHNENAICLETIPVYELTLRSAIIGHCGWADGFYGDYNNSIELNDYYYISDFMGLNLNDRKKLMEARAQMAANHIEKSLKSAFSKYKQVYLLTHVPPWDVAAYYNGRMSDSDYLPHFSSKIMGDCIENSMKGVSGKLTVLCGHTHGDVENQISDNIYCYTGYARYGKPAINKIFEVT